MERNFGSTIKYQVNVRGGDKQKIQIPLFRNDSLSDTFIRREPGPRAN